MPLGNWLGVVALAMWMAGVSTAWVANDREPPVPARNSQSLASLAWPGTTVAPTPSLSTAETGLQAAPVESLVGGLEARLEQQPNDPQGWTLLAQSYAYASNEEGVERAIRRAVELGVDEQALRGRVAGAKRRAHPLDAVEEALRAGSLK